MKKENIFDLTGFEHCKTEVFQKIAEGSSRIERIVSLGQTTPENEWYDQESDEWVLLIQGVATIEFFNIGIINLTSGDYILIKAHQKHRVTFTSIDPACIWLAVHGNFST
jgi:cupin 2 domain-containing protein